MERSGTGGATLSAQISKRQRVVATDRPQAGVDVSVWYQSAGVSVCRQNSRAEGDRGVSERRSKRRAEADRSPLCRRIAGGSRRTVGRQTEGDRRRKQTDRRKADGRGSPAEADGPSEGRRKADGTSEADEKREKREI